MELAKEAQVFDFTLWPYQLLIRLANPNCVVDLQDSDVEWIESGKSRSFRVGDLEDNAQLGELLDKVALPDAACRLTISDGSTLSLAFKSSGAELVVVPNRLYEAWGVSFIPPGDDGIAKIICAPGGKLAIFDK